MEKGDTQFRCRLPAIRFAKIRNKSSPKIKLGLLDLTVFDDDGVEERHGFAEFGANLFDLQLGFGFADAREFLAAGFVLGDELFGEAAVLNVVEERLHRFFDLGGDDAWAGYVV